MGLSLNNDEEYLDWLLNEVAHGNIETKEFIKRKLIKLIKFEIFETEVIKIIREVNKNLIKN